MSCAVKVATPRWEDFDVAMNKGQGRGNQNKNILAAGTKPSLGPTNMPGTSQGTPAPQAQAAAQHPPPIVAPQAPAAMPPSVPAYPPAAPQLPPQAAPQAAPQMPLPAGMPDAASPPAPFPGANAALLAGAVPPPVPGRNFADGQLNQKFPF